MKQLEVLNYAITGALTEYNKIEREDYKSLEFYQEAKKEAEKKVTELIKMYADEMEKERKEETK